MSPFLLLRVRNQCAKNATRQPLKAEVMMSINKLNIRHTPPLCVKVTPEMLGDHYIISFIYYISHNIKVRVKRFLVVYANLIAIF
ncbi:hypothetical protein TUM20400_16570 [Staphylococcus aureus]|nr:hypothetical protein TUM20400_16570 [Staphylococcus aureus]